jgi:hypothetical protein
MKSNKILQLVILCLMMLLSMWAVSALLEAREQTRNVLLGVGFFFVLLLALWRSIPVDAKLLYIIILGYALGGKGFAYVSPMEPIYIGEICIAICMCGLLKRLHTAGVFRSTIHKLIWLYLIYAGMHLIVDYNQYRMLAIRDSATVYYALYFFVAYSLFQDGVTRHAFERVIKIAMVFAIVSKVIFLTMSLNFPGFAPHDDAMIALNAAAVVYLIVKAIETKKILYYAICGCVIVMFIPTKTAGHLALITVCALTLYPGRIKGLLPPVLVFTALMLLGVCVMIFLNADRTLELLTGGETSAQLGMSDGEFVGLQGTSKWRWDWWMTIWDDVMQNAPFWGLGFGSDISSAFLGDYLGSKVRYPHCIIFTIVGRLGIIGLVFFILLFTTMGIFCLKFCSRYFTSKSRLDADLICFAVVIAGMVNALLQATYEVPHGAITHWVCLGYMVARYYGSWSSVEITEEELS